MLLSWKKYETTTDIPFQKLAAISLHFFWYEFVVGSDNYQKTFDMTMEENHQRILEIASKYQVSAVNQVNEIGKALTFWCEILF